MIDKIKEKINTFIEMFKKQAKADETIQQMTQGSRKLYSDAYTWLEKKIRNGECL